MSKKVVLISGGGPSGITSALMLAKHGYKVVILGVCEFVKKEWIWITYCMH